MKGTLTATFRVVTPMFLGGVDPLAEPELRVPSIKGALRFWWRTLMWGRITDVNGVRSQESALFGSSDEGQSQVLLWLESPRTERTVPEANVMTENWPQGDWKQYTGYGLRDKGPRRYIKPGHEWRLKLNLRRCNEEQAAQVISAIKMMGLAGGLGSRSRKGWGSVTLTKLEGADWHCPESADSWQKTLESLLVCNLPESASYTAFTRAAKWSAGPIKTSAEAAQMWLGRKYQQHVKSTEPKDYRAQFGLPRNFKGSTSPRHERRASSLILHIHHCLNSQALPTALWLPSEFLKDKPTIPGSGKSAYGFVETLNS